MVGNLLLPAKSSALPSLALPNNGIYNAAGNQIYYNSLIFAGPNIVKEGDSLTKQADGFNYKVGTHYYLYLQPSDEKTSKAFIIVVDKKTEPTKGQYSEFVFDTTSKTYSKRSNSKNISLSKGEIPTVRNCNIPWLGWLICPIANTLATALDDLYNVVTDILVISPVDLSKEYATGQQKPIYALWSLIRNISNIVFIIIFILVVLSYVTGFGLSNYQLKKIFPRLIVTAIMVNISLTICILMIDVFNLLGYSSAQIFLNIQRATMPESDLTAINAINWGALLASAYGVGSLGLAFNGGVVGVTLLTLGGMAGALATIVSVVVALSARQALIIILTIVSPLACVLNLLPNTETWFKKWWESFWKILAIFPIFGLIYGVSQLTSSIIIQTANDSFILILVGLIVKVVPFGLLITIIKSFDHILDTITRSVSNKTKSLGEGMQEYFNRKQEIQKIKYASGSSTGLGRLTPHGMAQSFEQGRRRDEANLRAAKARQNALYAKRSSKLDQNHLPANADAKAEFSARAAEASADAYKTKLDAAFETISANIESKMLIRNKDKKVIGMKNLDSFKNELEYEIASSSLVKQIYANNEKSMKGMRTESQYGRIVANVDLPEDLRFGKSKDIRSSIAGINDEFHNYILADVINTQRKEVREAEEMANAVLQQINLSEAEMMSYITGTDYNGKSDLFDKLKASKDGKIQRVGKDGVVYTLEKNNKAMIGAAINFIGNQGRSDLIQHMTAAAADVLGEVSGEKDVIIGKGRLADFTEKLADINANKGSLRQFIKVPDRIRQNLYRGDDTLDLSMLESIGGGRISADKIAALDKDNLNDTSKMYEKLFNDEKILTDETSTFIGRDGKEYTKVIRKSAKEIIAENAKKKGLTLLENHKRTFINLYKTLIDPQTASKISEDKRIPIEKIMKLITKNTGFNIEQAKEIIRKEQEDGPS